MFGFGPISSTSISGDPFKLIAVPLALVATTSLSFAVSGRAGLFIPMGASVSLTFGVTPGLSYLQAISATTSLTFGGTGNLRIAGKPLVFNAVPVSFTFRAMPETYEFKAMSEQFTFRGVR